MCSFMKPERTVLCAEPTRVGALNTAFFKVAAFVVEDTKLAMPFKVGKLEVAGESGLPVLLRTIHAQVQYSAAWCHVVASLQAA